MLAQREFRRRFPGRPTPTGQTLRRLATRLEETGPTRDVPKAVRLDGARYRAMITEFFLPQLDELGLENMWFQQDGATAHTT